MSGETNWVPGVVVLLAALVAGTAMALRTRGGKRIAALTDAKGDDLERKRDGLYQQIRELDAGRSAMEVDDYRQERHRIELEAARTLRAMDVAAEAPAAPTAPRKQGWSDRHPRVMNALWGAGAGIFAWGLLMSVQEFQKPKEQMGGAQQASAQADDTRLQQALAIAKAAADAAPEDNEAQLQYAKLLLQADQTMDAFQVARKVTDRDPENPTARTYQAVVLIQIGDFDMAEKALDKVLAGHPDHVEALGYRGLVYLQKGDREKAATTWEHLLQVAPEEEQEFAPLIAMARNPNAPNPFAQADSPAAGQAAGGAGAGGPMSGGGAHVDAADDVQGRIVLDPALGAATPGQVILLYARPTGVQAGPPSLARRFTTDQLPIDFRLGSSDSPMGGGMPAEMWLSARIDSDGNPMTHSPTDAEARVEGVKPGQTGVVLTLTTAGGAASSSGAPAAAGMSAPSAAVAPTGAVVAGTIQVDPGAGTVAPGQTMFVYVRAAGATSGPPVLAKRLVTGAFPLSFSLSAADSPMGGAVPDPLSVSVRIDADGDPMTHGPGDLQARLDGVKAGTTGLALTLQKPPS